MNLLESLPKNDEDKIILNPGAKIKGIYYESYVDEEWFENNFYNLSIEDVPITQESYEELKAIDNYWKINAEKWRNDGII